VHVNRRFGVSSSVIKTFLNSADEAKHVGGLAPPSAVSPLTVYRKEFTYGEDGGNGSNTG
jgi:hypothetical protein